MERNVSYGAMYFQLFGDRDLPILQESEGMWEGCNSIHQLLMVIKFFAHPDVYRENSKVYGVSFGQFHKIVMRFLQLILVNIGPRYIKWISTYLVMGLTQ